MNKKILLLFFFYTTLTSAQTWKIVDLENNKAKTELEFRKTTPTKYNLYHLDTDLLKNDVSIKSIISLPNHNGTFSKFSITENQNFTNPVASKYGYIKSFSLKGIDDKTATGKISIGKDGVHAVIFSGKHSTTYIDPYTKNKSTYILYNRENLEHKDTDFGCLLEEDENIKNKVSSIAQKNADDGKLRTYKLALACTGEYAQFHVNNQGVNSGTDDEKTAAVLSAMNTTMTRVNGLFERDIAASFTIVLNSSGENELIFLDSETDNLTNDSASTLINESQSLCDNTIGSDNYDIGHTFSTGAGGLAGLGVLCSNGQKGRGVTGTNSPIGDTYDVDYVAHEIGHQFGAAHTFNNSCSGNRSSSTAVEPGSGTTIMAYAGICAPNIQNQSDDYFHAVSIDQMWTVMQQACGVLTDTNNVAPIVNAGNDFSVPRSTPLVLKGNATDADSESLTYTWEQTDIEIATMPPLATSTAGPAFKSVAPSNSPDRYLPRLSSVISSISSAEWEVLPSVAREMNFSLLVRDNNANGGATGRDNITVTFLDIDPFTVTSQSTSVTWNLDTTETITWDKSTTDQAPINCQNVKIMLSTDGGKNFDTTIIESTPNDGSYDFFVTDELETTEFARIMVMGIDQIFFNVNTSDFTIQSTDPLDKRYCESNFTKDNSEYISNVTFGSINNNSDDAELDGYEDFTNINTDLIAGDTYTLSVTLNPLGFQDHCYAFIDWNYDGEFDINTERYDLGNHSGTNSTGTMNIQVPSDAYLGETRMRIIIEYYTDTLAYGTGPCDSDHNTGEYGETEDYTLNIVNTLSNDDNVFENFAFFPNPVEDSLHLIFNTPNSKEPVNFDLFDLTGKSVKSLTLENNSDVFNQEIDFNGLNSGIYMLKIKNGDKQTFKKLIFK